MTTEREWKWEIGSADLLDEIAGAPLPEGVEGGDWRTSRLENRYFDTRDRRLSAAAAAFRARRHEDDRSVLLLTLKEGHRREGAFHRMVEIEGRVPDFDPLEPWRTEAAPVRRLVELVGRRPVEVLVRFETSRLCRELRSPSGGGAVLALDTTRWADGGFFRELELELSADGKGDRWERWMLGLARRHRLVPSEETKLARAMKRMAAER
ncbi:MAG: hypothetical protein CME06_01890 [Gemmatimonadetes bacterium]|nr:hypothetical protein [Gemmatimonadota bacterium]